MTDPPNRRQTRYGKLKRGWDWRTTPERLEKAESLVEKLGITKTEFLEAAIDLYITRKQWELEETALD